MNETLTVGRYRLEASEDGLLTGVNLLHQEWPGWDVWTRRVRGISRAEVARYGFDPDSPEVEHVFRAGQQAAEQAADELLLEGRLDAEEHIALVARVRGR